MRPAKAPHLIKHEGERRHPRQTRELLHEFELALLRFKRANLHHGGVQNACGSKLRAQV